MTHFDILNRINLNTTPQQAAAQWGVTPDSLELVNQGINVVFRFTAHENAYFLNLTHVDLKSQAELEANWNFLQHLVEEGAPVSPPVLARDGQKVIAIQQEEDTLLATVTRAMPGELVPEGMLSEETFHAWGRALAQMHNAAGSFQPADSSLYKTWDGIWKNTYALINRSDQAALHEFEQVDAWFQDLSADTPDFGLTHADFRAGNMLLHEGEITILDFDEPVWHWWAADMARPFLELSDYAIEDRRQARGWFVQGYRSVRSLDEFWVENLPWFMRMKTLDIYAWSAAHWDERQEITRQEWMEYYQRRFENLFTW